MNLRIVASTVLLATSMLVAQSGFGQIKSNDIKPSAQTDTSFAQVMPSAAVYSLDNQRPTTFTYTTIPGMQQKGLAFDATNPNGKVESFSVVLPSREELKKFGAADYNAVIAPIAWATDGKATSYGRSEYASFVVAKDKRAQLTDKLLNDADALQKFLNQKGNITEIDRGIDRADVQAMFRQNQDKKAAIDKDKSVAFGMVGQ